MEEMIEGVHLVLREGAQEESGPDRFKRSAWMICVMLRNYNAKHIAARAMLLCKNMTAQISFRNILRELHSCSLTRDDSETFSLRQSKCRPRPRTLVWFRFAKFLVNASFLLRAIERWLLHWFLGAFIGIFAFQDFLHSRRDALSGLPLLPVLFLRLVSVSSTSSSVSRCILHNELAPV